MLGELLLAVQLVGVIYTAALAVSWWRARQFLRELARYYVRCQEEDQQRR